MVCTVISYGHLIQSNTLVELLACKNSISNLRQNSVHLCSGYNRPTWVLFISPPLFPPLLKLFFLLAMRPSVNLL